MVVARTASAQAGIDGVWALDPTFRDSAGVYAELRVVRHLDGDLHVTVIDFGTAWAAGAFRDVVRIMPWTFRYGEWGPRRGGPHSRQPRARARETAAGLILEKSTNSGNGNFLWLWTVNQDGGRLTHRDGGAGGYTREFIRNGALDDLMADISVAVVDEGLQIVCKTFDCRVIEFQSGVESGRRSVPRGAATTASLDSELRIEPIPN